MRLLPFVCALAVCAVPSEGGLGTSKRDRQAIADRVAKLARAAARRGVLTGGFKLGTNRLGFEEHLVKDFDPTGVLLPLLSRADGKYRVFVNRAGQLYQATAARLADTDVVEPMDVDDLFALELSRPGSLGVIGRRLARAGGLTPERSDAFSAALSGVELPLWKNLRRRKIIDSGALRAGLWKIGKILDDPYAHEDGRNYRDYGHLLGTVHGIGAVEHLRGLPPGSHWIDVAPGTALAMRQILGFNKGLRGTGVSAIAKRNLPAALHWPHERLNYIAGTYVENLRLHSVAPADAITDVYGAFLYAPHIDRILAKYAALMKEGALLFLHVPSQVVPILRDAAGRQISFPRWLRSISGFDVVQLEVPEGHPARRFDSNYVLVLRRNGSPIAVPSLKLRGYKLITRSPPPWRSYLVDGGVLTLEDVY